MIIERVIRWMMTVKNARQLIHTKRRRKECVLSFSMFSKQRLKETSFSSSGEQRNDDNDEVTDGGEDMNVALHFFFFFARR